MKFAEEDSEVEVLRCCKSNFSRMVEFELRRLEKVQLTGTMFTNCGDMLTRDPAIWKLGNFTFDQKRNSGKVLV